MVNLTVHAFLDKPNAKYMTGKEVYFLSKTEKEEFACSKQLSLFQP